MTSVPLSLESLVANRQALENVVNEEGVLSDKKSAKETRETVNDPMFWVGISILLQVCVGVHTHTHTHTSGPGAHRQGRHGCAVQHLHSR